MNHSPEPWRSVRTGSSVTILHSEDDVTDIVLDDLGGEYHDIERIIACVNACKGVKTSDLKEGKVTIHHDMVQDYTEPMFFMTGNESQIVEFCKERLERDSVEQQHPTIRSVYLDFHRDLNNAIEGLLQSLGLSYAIHHTKLVSYADKPNELVIKIDGRIAGKVRHEVTVEGYTIEAMQVKS